MSRRRPPILAAGFFWLCLAMSALPLSAEAQTGVASAKPFIITVNKPADVTVTIQLTDTRLIPASVNLQRLDANGKAIAVLGNLNDTGANGDAAAGDYVFSLRYRFTETSPALIQLRVSWALKGVLIRAMSNTVRINAVSLPPNPVAGSEGDTTLLGTDADGNGVRDDVDAFIASRYPDPQQRAVATTYAAAVTKMMSATDANSSYAAALILNNAQVCALNLWGFQNSQRKEQIEIEAAVLNNRRRIEAYFAANNTLAGRVFSATSICPLDGKPYNKKP